MMHPPRGLIETFIRSLPAFKSLQPHWSLNLTRLYCYSFESSSSPMLASRIGTLRSASTSLNLTARSSKSPCAFHIQFRTYAVSRFDPDRRPGVGRVRPKVAPVSSSRRQTSREQEDPLVGSENHPPFETDKNSVLWEASQRPPASNPEEGLKSLLLKNDLLVVTR